MTKWVISGIFAILCIVFAMLKSVWTGFIYFAITFLSLLCLFLVFLRIKLYIKEYHTDIEKEFKGYKADYINTNNISEEEFEANKLFHLKKFKKNLRSYKFIDIFKILFILSIVAICIFAIIKL